MNSCSKFMQPFSIEYLLTQIVEIQQPPEATRLTTIRLPLAAEKVFLMGNFYSANSSADCQTIRMTRRGPLFISAVNL